MKIFILTSVTSAMMEGVSSIWKENGLSSYPICTSLIVLFVSSFQVLVCCDYCDKSFHKHCHLPPLHSIPEGMWKCCECSAWSITVSLGSIRLTNYMCFVTEILWCSPLSMSNPLHRNCPNVANARRACGRIAESAFTVLTSQSLVV